MEEDPPGGLLAPERNQGGQDGQGYGRDGQELEQTRIDGGQELADRIDPAHVQEAEHRAQHQGADPQQQLFIGLFHGERVFNTQI